MKKFRLLITLSLISLMLVFGSISVFAVNIDGIEYNHYVYSESFDLPSPSFVTDASFRVYYRYSDSNVNEKVYYGVGESYYTVFSASLYFDGSGYIDNITFYSSELSLRVYSSEGGWVNNSYRDVYIPVGATPVYFVNGSTVSDDSQYLLIDNWYRSFFVLASDIPSGSGLAEDIFELFQSIIDWMVGFIGVFVGLFWTSESGFTAFGALVVIALGISIFFLVFSVVIKFFRFRGR